MSNHTKTLSSFIRWAREENAWSKASLARRSGLSERTIYSIESGKNVSPITLAKLSRSLEISLSDLQLIEMQPNKLVNTALLSVKAINDELIKYLVKHPYKMHSLSPREFELLIAEILSDMGGEIEITPETRDGGRDILAAFNTPIGKILTLVECKKISIERKVGIDVVERFLWTIDRKDRASCGLLATTSYFSSGAKRLQEDYSWKLKFRDFDGLSGWLEQYGTWARREKYGLWLSKLITEEDR